MRGAVVGGSVLRQRLREQDGRLALAARVHAQHGEIVGAEHGQHGRVRRRCGGGAGEGRRHKTGRRVHDKGGEIPLDGNAALRRVGFDGQQRHGEEFVRDRDRLDQRAVLVGLPAEHVAGGTLAAAGRGDGDLDLAGLHALHVERAARILQNLVEVQAQDILADDGRVAGAEREGLTGLGKLAPVTHARRALDAERQAVVGRVGGRTGQRLDAQQAHAGAIDQFVGAQRAGGRQHCPVTIRDAGQSQGARLGAFFQPGEARGDGIARRTGGAGRAGQGVDGVDAHGVGPSRQHHLFARCQEEGGVTADGHAGVGIGPCCRVLADDEGAAIFIPRDGFGAGRVGRDRRECDAIGANLRGGIGAGSVGQNGAVAIGVRLEDRIGGGVTLPCQRDLELDRPRFGARHIDRTALVVTPSFQPDSGRLVGNGNRLPGLQRKRCIQGRAVAHGRGREFELAGGK